MLKGVPHSHPATHPSTALRTNRDIISMEILSGTDKSSTERGLEDEESTSIEQGSSYFMSPMSVDMICFEEKSITTYIVSQRWPSNSYVQVINNCMGLFSTKLLGR